MSSIKVLSHDAATWSCKACTMSTMVSYMLHLCHSASAGSSFLPPKATPRNTSLCWKQRRATQPSHDIPHLQRRMQARPQHPNSAVPARARRAGHNPLETLNLP